MIVISLKCDLYYNVPISQVHATRKCNKVVQKSQGKPMKVQQRALQIFFNFQENRQLFIKKQMANGNITGIQKVYGYMDVMKYISEYSQI